MSEQKPTVEAGRRRPTGAGATGRAEAPSRRRSSGGSGGGYGRLCRACREARRANYRWGGFVLLIVLFLVFRLLTGGSDTSTLAPRGRSQVQAPVAD